ncbi:MAG: hypothetical protein DWQ05_01055 [Calditrichaeota bacterium]|nr:MAG: hypothetical protein DWQ05_01055 [Calditrichota bacterium]
MTSKYAIPLVLWISIVSLAIFSVFHFIIGFEKPTQFISLAINILLIFGIIQLKKWAYFLTIFVSLLAPIILIFQLSGYSIIILILNLTVLVPVLICTKSFINTTSTVSSVTN